ncbi:MAG: exodeoxyribonuclease VII large subunit [Bacilli bacterium]
MPNKYLTVSVINRYLKHKLDSDDNLQHVFLKGEISNFKAHGTGHLYFSIKDEVSKINAIMFSTSAKKLLFTPNDGTKVLICGHISVYEATGNYQIYVDEMLEDGVGNLYIAFEKLKKQLALEGLFNVEHKKEIPKYPSKIGVITANTGAAIKDIISTIKRRYPIAQIILFPSLVQGDNAKDDIVKNISLAVNYEIDVLIVGRGGGSIEDLWPFNEEVVARAIYNCPIPIISAVGHEVDYTIADFVADLRAPTPTAAAELAVPNLVDLKLNIKQLKIRLNENIIKKINFKKLLLDGFKNTYIVKNPIILYENKKQKLDIILDKLNTYMLLKVDNHKKVLFNIIDKLELLNPLSILKRGFSLTYKNDEVIKSVKKIKINDDLKIKLNDGEIKVNVKEIL